MKLLSVIEAMGSLCLLFVGGFPVSDEESPKIIGPRRVKVKANPGGELFLHCAAFANCDIDLTLIYWLVNGSFPEDTPSSGRIVEGEASTLEDGAIIRRSLLLKNVTTDELKSTFTCVVTNVAGMDQKHMTLAQTRSGSNVGNDRKHRSCT